MIQYRYIVISCNVEISYNLLISYKIVKVLSYFTLKRFHSRSDSDSDSDSAGINCVDPYTKCY